MIQLVAHGKSNNSPAADDRYAKGDFESSREGDVQQSTHIGSTNPNCQGDTNAGWEYQPDTGNN